MKMTASYNGDPERSLLIAAVTNTRFLTKVRLRVTEPKPFRSRLANLVYGWCCEFHVKYGKAPGAAIRKRFEAYARSSRDEDLTQSMELFLSGLSRESVAREKGVNSDYLVDQAALFFNRVRLEALREDIDSKLIVDKVAEAMQEVASFTALDTGVKHSVVLPNDVDALIEAMRNTDRDVLIKYPGAVGEFFSTSLSRDSLVAFMAPEKRGKTFFLMDVAWRAMKQKQRTLFYSVGDMMEEQVLRRFVSRLTAKPMKEQEVRVPKAIRQKEGKASTKINRSHRKQPSRKEIREASDELAQLLAHPSGLMRVMCSPNSTTRVADIHNDVESLAKEGWVPDVVVIDYADILANENPGGNRDDFRHQVNETWKALCRLSQQFHMLVVTATQSDSASYEADLLRRKNFSEDKRKYAHVTDMLAINQRDSEKKADIFRLNWIQRRYEPYSESRVVYVAGCLALANPVMVSTW